MSKQLFLERRYPGAHGSLIQFACQTPRFVFQVINQIPDNSDIHYRWPRRANAAYMGTRHFQGVEKAWVSTKTKRTTWGKNWLCFLCLVFPVKRYYTTILNDGRF